MNLNKDIQPISKADPVIKRILKQALPDWKGRKVWVQFSPEVLIYDLNWSGGTKNTYIAVGVDGKMIPVPDAPPWGNPYEDKKVALPTSDSKSLFVMVQHVLFCGKDSGVIIFAHPSLKTHLIKSV